MSNWLYESRPNVAVKSPERTIRFIDLNPHYGEDDLPLIVSEEIAIRKQINHLMSTLIGTEHFEPRFGTRLPYRIQEPISPVMSFILETDTIVALAIWMSDRLRVILPGVNIIPLYDEEGYSITIPYVRLIDNKASVYAFNALR